jgi:hypothetical protein
MDINYTAYNVSTPVVVKRKMVELLKTKNEDFELKDELHITICLGDIAKKMASGKAKNKDFQDQVNDYINTDTKKENIFKIVAIGVNKDTGVIAFKTESVEGENLLITDNNSPHITAYVPDGEKAFSSNKITEWEMLDKPILFKATESYYLKDETIVPISYKDNNGEFEVKTVEEPLQQVSAKKIT